MNLGKVNWHQDVKTAFKILSSGQKISFGFLLVLATILPLTVTATLSPASIGIEAYTPGTSPSIDFALSQNTPPIIGTTFLPYGFVGKNYNAKVLGYDVDRNDTLDVYAKNLPQGLNLSNCAKDTNQKNVEVTCNIEGKPKTQGNYSVTIHLSDNKDGSSEKTIFLTINNDK